jgi:plasmid stabilization system protein ParE
LNRYQLHPLADADFEAIARYTSDEWGQAQAARYGALLIAGMRNCAEKPKAGQRPFRGSNIFFRRCEHHYLCYRVGPDDCVYILAILHERMNLQARIAERLRML